MFKKITIAALGAATAMTAMPAAAEARPRDRYGDYGYSRDYQRQGYYGGNQRYRPGDYYRGQTSRNYYGRNRAYYGRCRDSGTTGTILGAIAGGLLGREIARDGRHRRGDGTAGAIVGAGAGALIGRAIDRDC